MNKVDSPRILIKVVWFLMTVFFVSSLTAQQISQKCHCDVTSSFCDFGCCCDLDCGSSISESCFYQKSSFYCPKTDFFKTIKPGTAQNSMCYYYNSTTELINQQSLINSQRTQFISEIREVSPIMSAISAGYRGYRISTVLTIGGKSTFAFIDASGNCVNSTAPNPEYSLRFGMNTKISCICNNCGTPLLFLDLMGKDIAQYLEISSNDIKMPIITDSSMTTLRITFIIGKYGSQKIKFIDKITYSYQSSGLSTRTLYINFIDADTIKEQDNTAPFFPQIPADIFYPIHVMS